MNFQFEILWHLEKSMAILPQDKLPASLTIHFLSAQQLFKFWFLFHGCLWSVTGNFFSTVEGDLTVESVLSGVHYYRCHDYVELLATVHLLPEFIKQHPKVNTCTITVNVEDLKRETLCTMFIQIHVHKRSMFILWNWFHKMIMFYMIQMNTGMYMYIFFF